jgi:hypothetical protein
MSEHQAHSNTPLSPEELAQSERGPAFAEVTAAQLFSAQSDGALALRVRRLNPARYRALKLEWQYETGQLARPDSHFK